MGRPSVKNTLYFQNIARGTTDPGYRIYNLYKFFKSLRACPPWWEHKPPRSESWPGDEWNHFGRVMLIDHVPELGAMSVLEHVQPLEEEIKIRTHHDKVCSVCPLNLDWDVVVFLNFRCAIFLLKSYLYFFWVCISDLLQIDSKFGHVTCIAWFQSWPPGCVTRIATLPWNAPLVLSVSIEFVSSSPRVTSV